MSISWRQHEGNLERQIDTLFAGKPETASINSSPEGLYRHTYNLTWTVRSREPLSEVRLLFRRLVRERLRDHAMITPGIWLCNRPFTWSLIADLSRQ